MGCLPGDETSSLRRSTLRILTLNFSSPLSNKTNCLYYQVGYIWDFPSRLSVSCGKSLPLGLVLLNKLLPCNGLLIKHIQALLQISPTIVTGVLQEHHVLRQFIRNSRGKERLEYVGGNLVESGRLAHDFAKLGDDSVGTVVIRGCVDALVEGAGEVLDGSLDKFSCGRQYVCNN